MSGPNFTLRLLLDEQYGLKPYTHCTLLCTETELGTEELEQIFADLGEVFSKETAFYATNVENFGSEDRPNWVISLSMGTNEARLRNQISTIVDHDMCNERGIGEQPGPLYLWDASFLKPSAQLKTPHLTIGRDDQAKTLAETFVTERKAFTFSAIDYKKVGPHDPIKSTALKETATSISDNANTFTGNTGNAPAKDADKKSKKIAQKNAI